MPKSFLYVIFAVVIVAVPTFFAVLFLGSTRRKKRLRATLLAQLDNLVTHLRQRNDVVIESLRATPGSSNALLQEAAEKQQALFKRFDAAEDDFAEFADLDRTVETALAPWLGGMPDSYAKRKLLPLQEKASEARSRYNDAVRVFGQGRFPLLPGAEQS